MDAETNEPLQPVASMNGNLMSNLTDDYLVLPPGTSYQEVSWMPVWWGLSENGETAHYDEFTLLHTARQIFHHEFDEELDPSITIPEHPPSTPPRSA
eukprot:7233817-Heterocapsa_arctica.AAC.1